MDWEGIACGVVTAFRGYICGISLSTLHMHAGLYQGTLHLRRACECRRHLPKPRSLRHMFLNVNMLELRPKPVGHSSSHSRHYIRHTTSSPVIAELLYNDSDQNNEASNL